MDDRTAVDPQTIAWTPGPTIELAPVVLRARAAIESVGRDLLRVPDDRLAAEDWRWNGGDLEIRYAFFRMYELLEAARADVERVLRSAGVEAPSGARLALGVSAARWSFQGLLVPLTDADLDADPGGGEWPIRETLGHVLSSQRIYARFTAWWLTQASSDDAFVPAAIRDELPEREIEATGGVDEIRARLDRLLDLSMARLGGLSEPELATRARWSGTPVTAGFVVGRWASHLREHAIQVEKTFVMIDRPSTEVERLVRLLFEAYGRLEETVFGIDADQVNEAATSAIDEVARQFRTLVAEVLDAA